MKIRILIILNIALIGNFSPLYSQDNGDHLEPTQSIYSLYDFEFEYYSKVRKIMFNGLSDSPEIRFQVMPSFFPENVVDIEYDRETGIYQIIYHRCKKMIWSNDKWEKVRVEKHRSQIEKESALKIKELFETAILQTKYLDPENEMIGLDGTTYYFSVFNHGTKTGSVWSPNKGTNMYQLVQIASSLHEMAKSNQDIVKLNKDEIEAINKLIEEIKYDR
jgi:hypothetical protein